MGSAAKSWPSRTLRRRSPSGPGPDPGRVRRGQLRRRDASAQRPLPLPDGSAVHPGGEVAGTVEALGAGVEARPVGTAVFALVGGDGSTGYAQYALADAAQVIPTPPGVGPDEAAGIVVAGATALLMLTEVGQLHTGETVLVEGAGGGVGGFAVQIAKILGGTVIAAASTPERREAARAHGADHVVDYTRPDWTGGVRELTGGAGVDLVLEVVGGPTFTQTLSALAPFGRVVVAGMAGRQPLRLDAEAVRTFFYTPALNQSLRTFNVGLYFGLRPQVAVAALQTLIGYVASGRVTVPVGLVLPLTAAVRAHELLENRQAVRKIILKPWE